MPVFIIISNTISIKIITALVIITFITIISSLLFIIRTIFVIIVIPFVIIVITTDDFSDNKGIERLVQQGDTLFPRLNKDACNLI